MRLVTKDDFDFSLAAQYRKIEPLAKAHVRIATHDEIVVSRHSTGIETKNIARPGDAIIKTKDDGDGYIMTAERFPEVYEHDPDRPDFYRNKETRTALFITEDVRFIAPWGREQNVTAGGVIVEAGTYIYGIDGASFMAKYGRVDDTKNAEVFVRLNEPLEIQLAKAQERGLDRHINDILSRMNFSKHRA